MSLEIKIFEILHNLTGHSAFVDWLIVFLGQYIPYFLFTAVILFIISQRNWQEKVYSFSVLTLAAIISRGILTEGIRYFYFRPRPFAVMNFEPLINHAASASLPSGHAALFFAFSFAFFLLNKKWAVWFTLVTAVAAVARVVSGTHWPLDIVAGVLVAAIAAFVVKWLLPRTLIK